MTSPTPAAGLFSTLPEENAASLERVALLFAPLMQSPGWEVYVDFVQRLRTARAMAHATTPPNPETAAIDAGYSYGYTCGLRDAVESVVKLVETHKMQMKMKEEKEESPRERAIRLHGRGGI